jgi:hypothetical protein
MKNIQGTPENLELFNKEGKLVYHFFTDSCKYSYECIFNDKGNVLTYKNSDGLYNIKRKSVTKEEYEAFIKGLK